MMPKTPPRLEAHEIQEEVLKRLTKYESRSFLERFALFMGMAQVFEMGLKNLLGRRYKYDLDKIEKWTLGRLSKELKKCRIRPDFIRLLESVVEYRNDIAHEFLANEAVLRSIVDGYDGQLEVRHLEKGAYELEQIAFLYEWCEKYDAWE